MKKLIISIILLFSSPTFAWYGPGFGPGFGMGYGWGGYPPGAYGAMGYGWGIQAPSFNYTQVLQQSPPIIVNNPPPVYRDSGAQQENERLRSYFGK